MDKTPDISAFVSPQGTITTRVTPKAASNRVVIDSGPPLMLRIYVTAVPADGKANQAVIKMLAKALGVAKSRVVLRRGATGKDKVFAIM